jgi:polyisoprenoid-binding protein YceI
MKCFPALVIALFPLVATAGVAQVASRNCPGAPPSLREYTVDFGHSIVEFSVRFAFTRVKGRFTEAKGTILYDSATPANSSITMILDSKSIDTGWPHRDEHLRTSDFFDTDKYPTIEFRSRRLRQTRDGWLADGELTMHGVTKPITIPFHFIQTPVRSAESHWMVMDVGGEMRLARADFGITGGSAFNSWFDKARAATMGDSVDMSFEVEGYLVDAASQRPPGVQQALARIDSNGVQAQIARLQDVKKTKSALEFEAYLTGADLITRGLISTCRLSDAVALANSLTELYPESHTARLIDGFVLTVAGDTRGAAAEFKRAKEIFRAPARDPNEKFPQDDGTWWYLDNLARSAFEWGYAKHAVPLTHTLAELYPGTARAQTTYGQALAFSGDSKEAAVAYARALQMDARETRALEWQRRLP